MRTALFLLAGSFVLFAMLFSGFTSAAYYPAVCTGSWTGCANAFANDKYIATANVDSESNATGQWAGYNFGAIKNRLVKSVKLGANFFTNVSGGVYIRLRVSRDGGATFGASHYVQGTKAKKNYWVDVTNDFAWQASDLNKSHINVSVECYTTTIQRVECRLDWTGFKVTYGRTLSNFSISLDKNSENVIPGKKAMTNVNVSKISGSNKLSLSYDGCPINSVCSFSKVSGTPAFDSVFSVITSENTPTGSYEINITGKNTRGVNVSQVYTLNVQMPAGLGSDCNVLKYDGNEVENSVNLVFVPSGFNGDMALFKQKVQEVWNLMKTYSPFDSGITQLNVFYVENESGSYCNFDSSITRLLLCDTYKAKLTSRGCTSLARQTVVIHNSQMYGGAGYITEDVATTTLDPSAPKIVVHELGHSLFGLGDEYTIFGGGDDNSYYSPNCDFESCNKWSRMIGYRGVGCVLRRCQGRYATGEDSIMYSLAYNFEEVNLRASCCAYYQQAGRFPLYCNQFTSYVLGGDLVGFCQTSNLLNLAGYAPSKSAVSQPYEYTFAKKGDDWVLVEVAPSKKGAYPIQRANGDDSGNITLKFKTSKGLENYSFNYYTSVEAPGEGNKMGGYKQVERKTISIIVDHEGGAPESFEFVK